MSNELSTRTEAIENSYGVKAVGAERWAVIEQKEGPEVTRKLKELLSFVGDNDTIVETAVSEWDSDDADDAEGIGFTIYRVCRVITPELAVAGISEGDVWYSDPHSRSPVKVGAGIPDVVPLQYHNERVLFGGENVEYDGCRSLDAITGDLGSCDSCKFNTMFREEEKKAGRSMEVPDDQNGKPATCKFSTVMLFVRKSEPSRLCMIQFSGKERQTAWTAIKKRWSYGKRQPSPNGYGVNWALNKPTMVLDLGITTEKWGASPKAYAYLTKVRTAEELYPEVHKVYRGLAELANRCYLRRLEAGTLKNVQDQEDAEALPAAYSKKLPAGEIVIEAKTVSPSPEVKEGEQEVPGFKL